MYIPPILLESLEEFRRFARDAALVTYAPEYFSGPFADDCGRLRRVTLVAIGVPVRGVPLMFKYVLDYQDLYDPSRGWEEQSEEVHTRLLDLVEGLQAETPVVRGRIDSGAPMGELLSART